MYTICGIVRSRHVMSRSRYTTYVLSIEGLTLSIHHANSSIYSAIRSLRPRSSSPPSFSIKPVIATSLEEQQSLPPQNTFRLSSIAVRFDIAKTLGDHRASQLFKHYFHVASYAYTLPNVYFRARLCFGSNYVLGSRFGTAKISYKAASEGKRATYSMKAKVETPPAS